LSSILILIREVLLDDVVSLYIDLLVGIILAIVDLLHAAHFLDEQSVAVDRLTSLLISLLVHFSNFENVL